MKRVVCLCAGSPSGFAFNESNYDNSNTNAGSSSHLCSKYNEDKDLAPWQKITYSKGVGSHKRRLRIEKQSIIYHMKRIGNLFDKICTLENLYLAHEKAKQGKSKRYGVVLFEKHLEENIIQLHTELLDGTYKTSDYDVFVIYDPKERTIFRLPFRDRVVHHAIMNILEPIWTSIFISNTYACIKGKGIHAALNHLKRDLRNTEQTKYCLKMDIKKFYPSIDHKVLKSIIRRKIKDYKLLNLLDGIIDSAPGVPIGNYLSQFFANLYLSYFDHWLKEDMQVRYYYRYADDMVILGESKEYLHSILNEINNYLNNKLNIQLKGNYQIFPVEARGVDFVGYVFYHTHILMRKTIKERFCKRVAKLHKKNIPAQDFKQQICPWLGWAKHCNSKHLLKKLIPK